MSEDKKDIIGKYKTKYSNIIIGKDDTPSTINTGMLSFDLLCDGLMEGKFSEFYGLEASGKSTLCYAIIANLQKRYKNAKCAIIDAEYSINNYDYLKDIGIEESKVVIFSTSEAEVVFDILEDLVTDDFLIVIVDSLAALLTAEEIEGDNVTIGGFSRMLGRRLKKLTGRMSAVKSKTIIIFTNQVRATINSFVKGEFGQTTTGGRIIKYVCSTRIEVSRDAFITSTIEGKEVRNGSFIKLKMIKSRHSNPFIECLVPIIFGKGYSEKMDLINILSTRGIINKLSNGWIQLKLNDETVSYRTRNELMEILEKDEKLYSMLMNKLKEVK